jgi:hypothetical protein
MDSKQRRIRKRLIASLNEQIIVKEPSQPHKVHKESQPHQSRVRQYFGQTISRTKVVWGLVGVVLALIAYYGVFRPHVSVDPDFSANPADPCSARFAGKNENTIFAVNDVKPLCHTIFAETSGHFRMTNLPARPAPTIPSLEHDEKTTIFCPPWVEGLSHVTTAYIDIDITYRPDWWPITKTQRFPLKGVIDSQRNVHWTHITLSELQAELAKL